MRYAAISAVLSFLTILSISSASADNGTMSIAQAWSRATPGAATTGVVYFSVTDNGAPDQLMGEASTPIAASAELHESKTVNGVAQMAPVVSLPIDMTTPITLAPGGYHLMLMGLKQSLKAGDHFPLTLHFQHAGDMTTMVTVERLGAAAPDAEMPGMDMGKMH